MPDLPLLAGGHELLDRAESALGDERLPTGVAAALLPADAAPVSLAPETEDLALLQHFTRRLWSLIVLPKRERQVTRREVVDDGQADMFGGDKPVAHGNSVSGSLPEASLLADFAPRLGGKTKMGIALGKLSRPGFIERRNGVIGEGPLLDVALDYRVMADRIIHGTLGEVLAAAGHTLPQTNAADAAADKEDDEKE